MPLKPGSVEFFQEIDAAMPWFYTTRIRKSYSPHNERRSSCLDSRTCSMLALDDFRQVRNLAFYHALNEGGTCFSRENRESLQIKDYWAPHNHLLYAAAPSSSLFAGLCYEGPQEYAELNMRLMGLTEELFLDIAKAIRYADYVLFPGRDGHSMQGGVDLVRRFMLGKRRHSRTLLRHILSNPGLFVDADLAVVNGLATPEQAERYLSTW